MKRLRSEQSRALRRRLMLHTLFTWVAFTAIFVAIALALNTFAVPKLANFIADQTGTTVYYDPEEYLATYTLEDLMKGYEDELTDAGESYDILFDDTPVIDELVFGMMAPADEAAAAAADEAAEKLREERAARTERADSLTAEEKEALGLDQDIATAAGAQTDAGTASADAKATDGSQMQTSVDAAAARVAVLGSEWRDATVGEVAIYDLDEDRNITETNYDELTPRKLAFYAAMSDYDDRVEKGGNWDILFAPNPRNDGLGAFEARELSTYKAIKVFKIPVAILLYLVGCLAIAMMELRRSLRCFDELSGAVAGLMADRTKPVSLPSDLSIAQSELNRIRMEALADERAAVAAEQRKNELVAYLAHDIRTPLTSVIGYLSLLDEASDLSGEQRSRFTHAAFTKAERLESLIEEFFEITRYNLQAIPIERSTVDVQLFLEQIADEFFPQATEKGVRVRVCAPQDQTFFVDPEKLARAVGNVVRNAVAYADAGTEVQVVAERQGRGAHAAGWRITVTDRGREISPVHLESIFEKFYREDGARNAQSGGAGLGLAIAKEIITAHGGTIEAESCDGLTTFTIAI